MGDDLGEEWWLDNAEESTKSSDNGEESTGKSKASQTASKHTKGKGKIAEVSPAKRKIESDPASQNKKKRRTKQKITEFLSQAKPLAATGRDLMTKMEQHFKEKLSPLELEDLQLDESHFLPSNTSSLALSPYLEEAVTQWNRDLEAKRPKETMSCLLLVITASARRAVDLNREAAAFKGKKCVSGKLFAKHMKILDQVKFLAKNRTQFAVGTPNRLAALLQQEALNLNGTRYVILDWNWRDVKLKRMCDIPELKADLFGLLEKYIIPQARTGGRLKIGLF